ncbi:GTP-binding protein YchF [Vittaforma corneae ATCC 50505]|uniref:Obg-like ATPase homolog n=1 Tax=Vittaforma corneae (strain ATCC 50505) TaxID=993615 RepID=L2GMJ2_VITCO|nr:GTP-binding protein YchF [Vittaforma corneae ATCC 50505]ELA42098.1 GTP-binding protein YchF [Vittaforma corneae ATCC 50505]
MAKKVEETRTKTLFQRANKSPNLSMGIVGLPNVGKSTIFNRLTKSCVPAENYPFCTIKHSLGRVKIDDPRVAFLEKIYKPKSTVHAYLTVTDIAGIVRGASSGSGLGNEFLDNIRNVDGIFLVVRCFEDNSILHVENSVDPIRDINIVRDELRIKDRDMLKDSFDKIQRLYNSKKTDKKVAIAYNTHKRLIDILEHRWINEEYFDNDELEYINSLSLLTTKNVVILANTNSLPTDMVEDNSDNSPELSSCAVHDNSKDVANEHLRRVLELYGPSVVQINATLGMESPDVFPPFPDKFVKKLVDKGYESLGLINFFTAGKDEVKSWTICKGDKAPKAAGVIHTDFERYFMSAEVMEYDEFAKHPSEAQMKSVGKYRQQGREYVIKDGDIIYFKHNVPRSGKK